MWLSGDRFEAPHDPVMVREVIGFLGGRGTVVDMTLGAGGHLVGDQLVVEPLLIMSASPVLITER